MVRDLEDSNKIKLEDSFRRIIRSRNGNGRHVSSEEILTKGVEFFIDRIFSDAKNSELTIPRRELVRALYYSGASATLQDASELCSSLAGHQVEYGENGQHVLYFESIGNDALLVTYKEDY